jgi:uncharacterized protein (DUF362 family)
MRDGHQKLKETLHKVLEFFLTDEDYACGIFIKPNIVFPVRPESGEITSPLLVRTLVTALRERAGNIDIILGEGVAAGCIPQENFRVSGYIDLAGTLKLPLLDLDQAERKTVSWKFGKLELPSLALERTYVSLPILKPSRACIISGALKNQKGLVQLEVKKRFHILGLHEQIAELNAVIQPALTIMDGSRFFGRKVLICGDNCGEIGAVVCQLLGIEEPEHVQLARSARVYVPGYKVEGDPIHKKQAASSLQVKEFKRLGRLRLWSNPRAGTMCRCLFQEIRQDVLRPRDIFAKIELLGYAIKGTEIVMGTHPAWRKEYSTVICVGNCTHRAAKEGGYLHVPGCPPTLDDLYDHLS